MVTLLTYKHYICNMRVIYFVIEPRLKRTIICSFGKFYGRMIVQLDKLKSCQFPIVKNLDYTLLG